MNFNGLKQPPRGLDLPWSAVVGLAYSDLGLAWLGLIGLLGRAGLVGLEKSVGPLAWMPCAIST